jgi:hypothetical protein
MKKTVNEINKGYSNKNLSRVTEDILLEVGGAEKYKNLNTGEIKNLFEIGYSFMEDGFRLDPNTANPNTIELKYIVKEGKNIVRQGGYKKVK